MTGLSFHRPTYISRKPRFYNTNKINRRCVAGRNILTTFKISLSKDKVMERSVIFLQNVLVILLVKYATSSENCTCQLPADFCKPNITAVQGKVLGSQLANETGDLVSDISLAQKIRYRVELLHSLINGSHELHLVNNTFKLPVPLVTPCNFNFTKGSSHVFVGEVNSNGRWRKLNCNLNIVSSNKENGSGRGFNLGGDDTTFSELCSNL